MIDKKIGMIGCGNMGEAIISRLLHKVKGARKNLIVFDIDRKKRGRIAARYKIRVAGNSGELAGLSDVVIVAVKPGDIDSVLEEISRSLSKGKLLISIAAGVTTRYIEKRLHKRAAVVRVMPNMGAAIGEAISSVSAGSYAAAKDVKTARKIFSSAGDVAEVEEDLVDAVTAVSGSGPAYFFYLAEILIEAARELGLDKDVAKRLVLKTALASSKLLYALKEGPDVLRKKVASKGGTTEAAFKVFESANVKEVIKRAVKAAHNRSGELSRA